MKQELRTEYINATREDLKESGALFAMEIIYAEPISSEKSLKMMDLRGEFMDEMEKLIKE